MKLDHPKEDKFHLYVLVAIIGDVFYFVMMTSKIEESKKHKERFGMPDSVIVNLDPNRFSFLTQNTCINCIFVKSENRNQLIENGNIGVWKEVIPSPIIDSIFECIIDGILTCETADNELLNALNNYREFKSISKLTVPNKKIKTLSK